MSYYKMIRKILLLLSIVFSFHFAISQESLPTEPPATPSDGFQNVLIEEMDKMLDLWYVKREISNSKSVLSQVEDDTTMHHYSDSLISVRLKNMSSLMPIIYNERIKSMIHLYLNRKRSSAALLGLAQYYFPMMEEIFDKYDVPLELIYLTIIESGLNPTAVSRAGATGIWQFMYNTGKMYDLEVNTFIDDRRDPLKATDAAARHLRDLHKMFNDWGLAISAYNCGAGNVRKAIQRSGGKTDFWSISRFLPKETQNYFPAYIGAYYMMKFHSVYDIKAAKISIPSAVDTIMVGKEVHFAQIATVLDIDMEEIRTLNPQYKRDVIPAFENSYPLRLRSKDILRFITMKDSICAYNYEEYFAPLTNYVSVFTGKPDESGKSTKKYHIVKSGESLSKIANKYGLSLNELKTMNHLTSNYISPKMKLVVGYIEEPKPQKSTTASSDSTAKVTHTNDVTADAKTSTEKKNTTYYIVKKGDTLTKIATQYNIHVNTLAAYNQITNIHSLQIGQKIKIPH